MRLRVFILLAGLLGGIGSAFGGEWYVVGAGGEPWDPDCARAAEVETGWLWPQRLSPEFNLAEGQLLDRQGKLILRGLYARGGLIYEGSAPKDSVRLVETSYMVDRDSTTAYKRERKGVLIDLDLGERFGVNRLRFFPRPKDTRVHSALQRFGVYVCPGTPETFAPDGFPIFSPLSFLEDVVATQDTVDLRFPSENVRFVRIKVLTEFKFEIEEIEVFGEGFRPAAEYVSEPIDLGGKAQLGVIEWDELRTGDPLASFVQVYTHTGHDDTPFVYTRVLRDNTSRVLGLVPWKAGTVAPVSKAIPLGGEAVFNIVGKDKGTGMNLDLDVPIQVGLEYWRWLADTLKTKADSLALTEEEYQKLLTFDLGNMRASRGESRADMKYWSPWQPAANGVQIPSPPQRRYLQFKVVLNSQDIHSAAGISSLRFQYSTEMPTKEILGEIAPSFGVEMGQEVWFTYGIRALMDSTNLGFDHLEVFTPVRVDSIQGAKAEPGNVGILWLNEEVVPCSLKVVENNRFVVDFPKIFRRQGPTSLRLRFRCAMLGFGAHFRGRVFRDEDGDGHPDDLPQEVFPGDVGELGKGDADRLLVEVVFRQQTLLSPLRVVPRAFTPNGDGVNDEVGIAYDLFQLSRERKVQVEVCDVWGNLVKTVYHSTGDSQGRYQRTWDGRDEEGDLMPPGIYFVRVQLRADQGVISRMSTIMVAY